VAFAAFTRPGVPGMAMRVILDDKPHRAKRCLKLRSYGFCNTHDAFDLSSCRLNVKREVFLSSLPSSGILKGHG
jgi:hypothetical protein